MKSLRVYGSARTWLSDLELHEVAHESLLAAISGPPIRRLDLCQDTRTRDRATGSWITSVVRTRAVPPFGAFLRAGKACFLRF